MYASDSRLQMQSAVSWPSVVAGAFTAAAISLILLALGAGIGFSSLSPLSTSQPSSVSFTVKTAIWLIVVQWAASGMGGYLAGRLRTKWTELHTDEVFFRDTANGFLAWAVATVITAAFIVSATLSVAHGGAQAAGAIAMGPAGGQMRYFSDSLFRTEHPGMAMGGSNPVNGVSPASTGGLGTDSTTSSMGGQNVSSTAITLPNTGNEKTGNSNDTRAEAEHILVNGFKSDNFNDADKAYLVQMIIVQTGISQQDAAKRVDDTIAQINEAKDKAKQAAEIARKSGEQLSFFTFFSLLVGAFIASVAGALGGKRRDEY